jgi:ABC-type cobalamin/Fe3+-siderophores transport system ATPase subunit
MPVFEKRRDTRCCRPQEVTADIIKEVYDIAVEIHYHKGFPLVIPN